jgi:Sjoegren syndrome nuclear autoantigen 1
MAQQGATLQNYNNELVKCLEELCERRQRLEKEIEKDQREKQLLDSQLVQLQAKISAVDASLAKKLDTKAEYDKTIRESESAYMKILESSQVLLNVVKRDSMSLQKSEHTVSKANNSSSQRRS